jgi:hypothetical protein
VVLFHLDTSKNGSLGTTLDTTDQSTATQNTYDLTDADTFIGGTHEYTLNYTNDINPSGTTNFRWRAENTDILSFNAIILDEVASNNPGYLIFTLTYPTGGTPLRTLMGVGT